MPKKISRNISLITYRNLPLQEYDKGIDEDVFYYPKIFSSHWIKLKKTTNKKLTIEFKKLITRLKFKELIIFGQINKPWISKSTQKRRDYKPLIRAIEYFDSIKVRNKFNGAVKISANEINDFILHLYIITKCDSGFYDYHITDINENILFNIHYSGEIHILTLNRKTQKNLRCALTETNFIDSLRDETDRII